MEKKSETYTQNSTRELLAFGSGKPIQVSVERDCFWKRYVSALIINGKENGLKTTHLKSRNVIMVVFVIILLIGVSSTPLYARYYYEIHDVSSFTGANLYCLNGAASDLSVTFNTCLTGSCCSTYSTYFTITWYYNTTNSTSTSGATQVSQTTNVSTGTSGTLTLTYNPSTAATGNRYYFAVLSNPSSPNCGFNSTLSTGTQLVTVVSSPPSITCPANITANSCGATTVNYSLPTWTDDCAQTAPSGFGAVQYNPANGHYYALSNSSATWVNAEAACVAAGGHLVSIANAAENSFVVSISGGNTVFIGFTDQAVEGTFVWSSGESVTYTNWNAGEPNNSNNEDYTEFNASGGWNDINSTTSHRYILEFGYSLVQTAGLPSGATFPVGVTTNTYQYTNASGIYAECSFTVNVRPTPTAGISGTTIVCQNDPAPMITFTNPQSIAVTVTYDVNGSGTTTIDVPANSNNTVSVSTGTADIYDYNLVSVAYTDGAPGCSNPITQSATVTVKALPTYEFLQTDVSCYGGNDGSIKITVTSGTPDYQFSKDDGQTMSPRHPPALPNIHSAL